MTATRPRYRWGLLLPARAGARCYRCRCPFWPWSPWGVEPHTVEILFPGVAGQFALCEWCWNRSGLIERIDAHAWVTSTWTWRDRDAVWLAVEEAVLRAS